MFKLLLLLLLLLLKTVNSKDYSKNNINPLIFKVTRKSGIYQTIFQLDIN